MLDMHTHIIPFVDDGSKSMEESINLIKYEISNGVDEIVCTPHFYRGKFDKSSEELKAEFAKLCDSVKKENLNVKLYLGQEIMYSRSIDIISKLNSGELLTINNTNYVLLEFRYKLALDELRDIIYSFKIHGYKIILAHIDRYYWMNEKYIDAVKNEGGLVQVNADSLLNKEGIRVKLFVKRLLRKGKVDFIASDTHFFRKIKMKSVARYYKYLPENKIIK